MSASVFADEGQSQKNGKVYTTTIEGRYQSLYWGYSKNEKTVTSYKSLGLTLAPGDADWSMPVTFNFSVPKNAKVKKIEFDHGYAQTGGKHL